MHRWRFCIFHCPRPPTEGGGGESSTLLCPTATLLFDLFLLVTYHERNLQPLAEGEFCNGTSFCLRQEPVSSVASTMRWQVAPMESYLPILCMCTNVRLYFRQVSSTYMSNPVLDVHHVLPYQPEICLPRWHRLTAFAWLP